MQGLYAIVVAPIAGELSALEQSAQSSGKVPILLWSLDGAMRYLPMAALYNGHRFLVERFENVLFTPESYGHMTDASGAKITSLSVLAMGLSRSYGGLPPLPGVLSELNSVVHDPAVPESHVPMTGVLLPNERFTYAALKSQLCAASFPVGTDVCSDVGQQGTLQAKPGCGCYLGLGPRRSQSGDRDPQLGITKAGNTTSGLCWSSAPTMWLVRGEETRPYVSGPASGLARRQAVPQSCHRCRRSQACSSALSNLDHARAIHPVLRSSYLRIQIRLPVAKPRVPVTACRLGPSQGRPKTGSIDFSV